MNRDQTINYQFDDLVQKVNNNLKFSILYYEFSQAIQKNPIIRLQPLIKENAKLNILAKPNFISNLLLHTLLIITYIHTYFAKLMCIYTYVMSYFMKFKERKQN